MAGPGDARRRLEDLSREWRVALHRTSETASSVIGFGERSGRPVVLKVATRRHDEWNAGRVVQAFAGRGMVRALECVPGAVLLEEVRPGTPLVTLVREGRETDAHRAFVGIIEEMSAVGPEPSGYRGAGELATGFDQYLAGSEGPVPRELATSARDLYRELCGTQREVRLLHGDLQHYNVLWDEERGWLAIDPKGIVAELEFELGAILRNPRGVPDLHTAAGIERRMGELGAPLGLDATRVAGWTFAQAVLSAIWMVEDEGPEARVAGVLRVARAARSLMNGPATGWSARAR